LDIVQEKIKLQFQNALNEANAKQIQQFLLVCAIRVVPLIGTGKQFAFFADKKVVMPLSEGSLAGVSPESQQGCAGRVLASDGIQKNLFTLFHAIDCLAYINYWEEEHVRASRVDICSVLDKVLQELDESNHRIAIKAIKICVDNALSESITTPETINIISHEMAIVCASFESRFPTNIWFNPRKLFIDTLLDDIEIIKGTRENDFKTDTNVYGDAWALFLQDLKDVECEYWAALYEYWFSNNFDYSVDELKKRFNISAEICELGATSVARYMMGWEDENDKFPAEARIIVIGYKGAGKTSISRKIVNPEATMPEFDDSTVGIEISEWKLDSLNVHIWDFAGDAITHAIHSCFMRTRCLYIYVHSSKNQFDANPPEYWLEQIGVYGKNSSVLFLINLFDGNERPFITYDSINSDDTAILAIYAFDISNENIKTQAFSEEIIKRLNEKPIWNSQNMHSMGYRVKNVLSQHFKDTRTDSITMEQFDKILMDSGIYPRLISKMRDELLNDLQDLGICIKCERNELLLSDLIINPAWITDGIYRLIRYGDSIGEYSFVAEEARRNVFNLESDKQWYSDMQIERLYELMEAYGFAYFKFFGDLRIMVVPLLLPFNPPDNMLFDYDENNTETLKMVFTSKGKLPPNIVSRFIAQKHNEITIAWRKGALLKFGNITALVIEDDRTRSITVTVSGSHKSTYIAELRTIFKKIFAPFKAHEGFKVGIEYQLIVPPSQTNGEPYMARGEVIQAYYKKMKKMLNENTGKPMALKKTMRAYKLT